MKADDDTDFESNRNLDQSPRISLQTKLTRIRPPRVQIDYEVETGGALERRELPFVIGVLADLSGARRAPYPPIRERTFVAIDIDNFDQVMERITPGVEVATDDGVKVALEFRKLEDFDLESVAAAVPGLAGLPGDIAAARLNAVLHAPAFKRLEATWRGLRYLVTQVETGTSLKVRVLDVTKRELLKDLPKAPAVDQSGLFRKISEEPFGTVAAEPFGLVLVDFEFGSDAQDIEVLQGLAAIGSAAHTPFVGAAAARLFDFETFGELEAPRDLGKIFLTAEYAAWNSFRDSHDARFVGLTVPRMLLRRPWRASDGQSDVAETIGSRGDLLWGNAAYALAVCVANAFARYGWCANIRGIEGGGIVEGLPSIADDESTEAATKSITEVMISDRREMELSYLGVIPLLSVKGRDFGVFFSMSTCARPPQLARAQATANSRLGTQLQYVLTASRFAHYLRCLTRDKIGSFMTRAETEHYLNEWIAFYVLQDDQGQLIDKAKRPLREGRVEVVDVPGQPGAYRAVVYLRPHYQLEELSISLRLVVTLGPALGPLS